MSKTIYTYEITDPQVGAIVTDLESRQDAREELQLVKKQGFPKAKILQRQYQLVKEVQVR
jgi:hypothetical protein|nr:MAG TPA: hypothetical protein [Caudoviricetes sp.]